VDSRVTRIRSMGIGRLVAAALVLASGAIHLKLYFDGYRDFPNANLGRSFLLNAAAALVVAALLVVWRHPLALVGGLLLVNGTLVGFALSRTGDGIFGFTESGFNPSPEAVLSLVVEIGAAVVLLLLLALEWRSTMGEATAAS
jgi:hypothetical protein